MAVNVELLKEEIKSKNFSHAKLAEEIGVDRTTLFRKLSIGGSSFTVEEVSKIKNSLKLSNQKAIQIFFNG